MRSQKRLLSWRFESEEQLQKIQSYCNEEIKINPPENPKEIYLKVLRKFAPQHYEHLTQGASATNCSLFKQRQEPIEYIYSNPIPMTQVEKVGEASLSGLEDDFIYFMRFFRNIFQGQPEEGMLKLLRKNG